MNSRNAKPSSEREELAALINSAMQRLADSDRLTLILVDMHGLSYEAIAKRMGVPRATVQARLSRARLRLRDYLLTHQDLLPAVYRFTPSKKCSQDSGNPRGEIGV